MIVGPRDLPPLLILDVRLPGLGGLEFANRTERARAPRSSWLPVTAFSCVIAIVLVSLPSACSAPLRYFPRLSHLM